MKYATAMTPAAAAISFKRRASAGRSFCLSGAGSAAGGRGPIGLSTRNTSQPARPDTPKMTIDLSRYSGKMDDSGGECHQRAKLLKYCGAFGIAFHPSCSPRRNRSKTCSEELSALALAPAAAGGFAAKPIETG